MRALAATTAMEYSAVHLVFLASVAVMVLALSVGAWREARVNRGCLPFTCPQCGARSWHPEDLRQGYCGRCRTFTAAPTTTGVHRRHP